MNSVLSILKALLITKFQPELCRQNQFYSLILFSNYLRPREVNITYANFAGLRSFFPSLLLAFLVVTTQILNSSHNDSSITDTILRRDEIEIKGPYLRIF